MRKVFGSMFSVPESEADIAFRCTPGDLATREVERDFVNENARFDEAVESGDLAVNGLTQDVEAEVNDVMSRVSQSEPELAQTVDAGFVEA